MHDAVMLGSATVASRVVLAIWLVLCARLLGVRVYGRFSVLLAVLLTAAAVADTGVPTLVTRRVAAHGLAAESGLVVCSLVLQGTVAVLAALVTFVIALVWVGAGPLAGTTAGIGTAAVCLAPIGKGVLRSTNRVAHEGRLQTMAALGLLVGTLTFLGVQPTVGGLLAVYAVTQALNGWALLRSALSSSAWPPGAVTGRALRDLFVTALPLSVLSTASLVYLRADVLALGWARPEAQVGYYSASLQLYQGAWIFGAVISVVSLPWLVRGQSAAAAPEDWTADVWRLSKWMFILGLSIGIGLLVTAPRALPFVLGEEFEPSVRLLQILVTSLPLVYLNFALGQILIALEKERVVMINAVILAVIAVVLFPFAARQGGGHDVAIVVVALSILSTFIQGTAAWSYARGTYGT